MNPRDIMTDAIHNFHPQYQQYTQYSSGKDIFGSFSMKQIWISYHPLFLQIRFWFL